MSIYNDLVTHYGAFGLLLMLSLTVLFIVQLTFFIRFGRLSGYRNSIRGQERDPGGISVVVVLREEPYWYLEEILPRLLAQDYDRYEVIVVEVGTREDFSAELASMKEASPHLLTTRMKSDRRFPINDKMAYNVGIKAANYGNIVLTTPDAIPVSAKWLGCMAKGFANGQVVISYSGLVPADTFVNRMMRCSRVMSGTRYLWCAVTGKPYRGSIHNLGFTSELYFSNKGFGNLNMNIGIDDLFVQRIADGRNTSVVMNPHASVRQQVWGGTGWWWSLRKADAVSFRDYPAAAKSFVETEIVCRTLFYAGVITAIIVLPPELKAAAGALFIARAFVVRSRMKKVMRRLGEKGLGWSIMLYDIINPFADAVLALSVRLRKPSGVWK